MKTIAWVTGGAILLITIIAFTGSHLLKQFSGFSFSGIRTTLKNAIENVSLADTVFLNGLLQLIFIATFLLWAGKYSQKKKLFSFLLVANLFIMAQLVLPITFVGKTPPREINAFIHASPKGFPTSGLEKSIGENSSDALDHFDKIALSYFYNKKIGISRINNSPSFLKEQDQFLNTGLLYSYVSSMPVIYIADSVVLLKDTNILNLATTSNLAFADSIPGIKNNYNTDNKANIKKVSANRFEIETQTSQTSFLVLTQNYYHHWKVWVDDKPATIQKVNMSFMGASIPAGTHHVVFRFVPTNTIKALWVMLATVVILIITAVISLIRKYRMK